MDQGIYDAMCIIQRLQCVCKVILNACSNSESWISARWPIAMTYPGPVLRRTGLRALKNSFVAHMVTRFPSSTSCVSVQIPDFGGVSTVAL